MKLQDLHIVYICPDHNDKYHARKEHMDSLLQSIGCTRVIHYKSSSSRYPQCLSEATIDILQQFMDEPVLILEDDVEFTGQDTFDVPPDVDAIYFGLSRSAGHPTENRDEGCMQYVPFSSTQIRVYNMLATHAILYISRRYKERVINTLQERLQENVYNDVLISRLQPQYHILANKIPSFYQSAKFNRTDHEERWTRWSIQ